MRLFGVSIWPFKDLCPGCGLVRRPWACPLDEWDVHVLTAEMEAGGCFWINVEDPEHLHEVVLLHRAGEIHRNRCGLCPMCST